MSDETKKPGGREYSVEEILAEYGSKGKGAGIEPPKTGKPKKVVEFPTEKLPKLTDEEKEAPKPPSQAAKKPSAKPTEDGPIPEIVPDSVGRAIGARLHTLLRRADHYADHMYDGAAPDAEQLRAEKYTPGVDREEAPQEKDRPRPAPPKARPLPPDQPPAKLAARYQNGLRSQAVRMRFATFFALCAGLCSLELPFLPWAKLAAPLQPRGISVFQLRCWVLAALLCATALLCYDIVFAGARQFFTLRPRGESVLLFSLVFTLLDALTAPSGRGAYPPFCAVTALALAFALRGEHQRRIGDRLSAKTASQAKKPYAVSMRDSLWNAKPTYTKCSASPEGYGSLLQAEDGGHAAFRFAAPLLLLGALLCSVMASAGQKAPERFLWAASACFTAVSSWTALLAFAQPYRRLCQRLARVGAALAGWTGAARCRPGGAVVGDWDLFPPGSVTVSQVKVFGDAATEQVVGYTATMLRVMDCGLTRPFHDLLRAQGAFYREVSGVEWHEGGASGVIRNQEVLVGTGSYMHLMKVDVPPGHNLKNAVFCAIGGVLAGLFVLDYSMAPGVNPCLSAMWKGRVSPILATRDPNLNPAFLEQRYKLAVDKMDFPPVDRRLSLSRPEPAGAEGLVALLSREGLSPYCDAVVGGRRLRKAVRLGLAFSLLGSAVGLCLTFYLTSMAAYASLTAGSFLVFMAAWLVPQWLIANWVNQF